MKKKVLFIDRDGTIIIEPPTDYQVDSLEKLEFLPKAISALKKIKEELDYELVMVTNQDGLGTDAFPEDTFWPAQNKMLKVLEGEGVSWDAIKIDKTFESENAPTRKPRTGLLTEYFDEEYDLANSFVIGDRKTDVELAKNLNAQSIFISGEQYDEATFISQDWDEIYSFLKNQGGRTSSVKRKTNETDIDISLDLDGEGQIEINTGVHFFDHMLHQVARHGDMNLKVVVKGDLEIDDHHTIEDTAIALGEAFAEALGDKRGIERYGYSILPMDETISTVALDFSGRNWLVWDVKFNREFIGEYSTEMTEHFFKSFSDACKCNLNIKTVGDNAHHVAEATFKSFAKAIRMAKKKDPKNNTIPSTKGVI